MRYWQIDQDEQPKKRGPMLGSKSESTKKRARTPHSKTRPKMKRKVHVTGAAIKGIKGFMSKIEDRFAPSLSVTKLADDGWKAKVVRDARKTSLAAPVSRTPARKVTPRFDIKKDKQTLTPSLPAVVATRGGKAKEWKVTVSMDGRHKTKDSPEISKDTKNYGIANVAVKSEDIETDDEKDDGRNLTTVLVNDAMVEEEDIETDDEEGTYAALANA